MRKTGELAPIECRHPFVIDEERGVIAAPIMDTFRFGGESVKAGVDVYNFRSEIKRTYEAAR